MPSSSGTLDLGSSEKKNASINGLYARRAADHDGHGAYEKVGADAAVRPRFLYFWREKSRWKIDNKIPSEKSGFAYLKVAGVASPANAGPDCQWHVCDDKGEGYSKDPGVRCLEVAPRPGASAGEARPAPPASQDVSSSDDSSSDDGGDQTSGDDESSSASGSEQPAQKGATALAAGRQPGGAVRRRACAKMLVRSGLRCVCHFRPVRDCPGRPTGP
ncbi:unnamed protein product [Prorocentrum cordatum]|uniref:Uncharacterized protein n=1 Tax=Prorocentrum cordatum TaxID=2364126 RepID=A0ABN9T0P5_9DINO|nr:unnamed protein product [Polarella glacialis]